VDFRLIDTGWGREIIRASTADSTLLRVVCPFIKLAALNQILEARPKTLEIITRFCLADFARGVSDISALRRILDLGGRVRGIRGLHSKVFIFGSSEAIVTSANVTSSAFERNEEFGVASRDPAAVATCSLYFERLWSIGADLVSSQLDEWERHVLAFKVANPLDGAVDLPDYGATISVRAPVVGERKAEVAQAFVKFLGASGYRVPLTYGTLEEVRRAGCNRVLAYPKNRRPISVEEDALMFIGRLTSGPEGDDIRVFGRARAVRYQHGRDDAVPSDVARRESRAKYPHYIRVYRPEFVAGTMANGVTLNELMAALGANAFASTKRNAARNQASGTNTFNVDPRRAYLRKPGVELTAEAIDWLSSRLEDSFRRWGTLPRADLLTID
jgi:hypothetical protein